MIPCRLSTLFGAAEVIPGAVHYPRHHGQRNVDHVEHPACVAQGEGVIHPGGRDVGN